MECLKARLETFNKTKRSKQSLTRSTAGLKWPHPSSHRATPQTLAEAGFYYNPSSEDKDNVTCFMCGKELSDWDPDDNPFDIHWKKCRNTCAWAVARCGLIYDVDEDGNHQFTDLTRLPSSKAMEKARTETFTTNKLWPHDAVKGHGASSKKMAKAGFIYTPQSPGDDTATCLYCNLSLSGWDFGDNPTEEHLQREKKSGVPCVFFQQTPGRVTKATTASRKEAIPLHSDDELAMDKIQGGGTTRSKSRTIGSKLSTTSKTPASRQSTRATGTNSRTPASRKTADSEVESTAGGNESEVGKRVSKSKRKLPAKTKEAIQAIVEEDEEQGDDVDMEVEMVVEMEQPKEKPKRGRPPKAKKLAAAPSEESDLDRVPTKKGHHTRTRSRTQVESESDVPLAPKPHQSKTRSTTASKKGPPPPVQNQGKATSSKARVVDVSSDDEIDEAPPSRTGLVPPVTLQGSTKMSNPLDVVRIAPKQRGKDELQVEVVVPSPKGNNPDVDVPIEDPEPISEEPDMNQSAIFVVAPAPSTPRSSNSPVIVHASPAAAPPTSETEATSVEPDARGSSLAFTPIMAQFPVRSLKSLTEEEGNMTVEQYIRREMEIQYQQIQEDAYRRIMLFKEQAAETKSRIEAL
ncbi:uncharacterized protein FIBRA_08098 [Fibroporia radiculosa]|uniref:BIR-domain-containing protein n=1 Tax=Fibroporia radiculosa TaxID=599839 RepID=J4I252_9APHY|nr:uncharacterized protein FIBRA_08098 [Fibroporia radiculosa]CCM05862.1 predicted protein [Fibroporia radiculosa]